MPEKKDGLTHNFMVRGLCDRMGQFIYEAMKSQSANVVYVNVHDLRRFNDYLEACRSYRNWAASDDNPLDTPDTHPRDYTVTCPTKDEIEAVENPSVYW